MLGEVSMVVVALLAATILAVDVLHSTMPAVHAFGVVVVRPSTTIRRVVGHGSSDDGEVSSAASTRTTRRLRLPPRWMNNKVCALATSMTARDSNSDDDGSTDVAKKEFMDLCMSHFTAQALHAFCQMRLHHILRIEPPDGTETDDGDDSYVYKSLEVIVQELREESSSMIVDQDALLRILRLLAASGIVQEAQQSDGDGVYGFGLSRTTGALLQRQPDAESLVLHWMEAPLWNAWAALPDYVMGNNNPNNSTTPFEAANHGVNSDVYYGPRHADSLQHANALARYVANEEIRACVRGVDWKELLRPLQPRNHTTVVVDVGGHRGDVLKAVAAQHPGARYICFDRPSVIEHAVTEPDAAGAVVEWVGGDLLDPSTIPPCDIIFMKHIVFCELGDEDSRRALQSCHAALPVTGRLIVAEAALPDPGGEGVAGSTALKMDALMMLVGRPSAKTQSEWKVAASQTGFRLTGIQETHMPTCSILSFVKL